MKSSYSNASQSCVEVRWATDKVLIRDSKYQRDPANNPADQPFIAVPLRIWDTFLQKAVGEIDGPSGLPTVEQDDLGVSLRFEGIALRYTRVEWAAFCDGIRAGEFVCA